FFMPNISVENVLRECVQGVSSTAIVSGSFNGETAALLIMTSGVGALAGTGVGTDDSMMVDKLPKEINDMKIKVDKVEKCYSHIIVFAFEEMEATVVDGHGTETDHKICYYYWR
nr:shaggy-related protein kinase epsilon isoform X1 [Tanacetum cinerariifolium]